MPGTISEEPPDSLSCMFLPTRFNEILSELTLPQPFTVSSNFWGKNDAGVTPMLERMHNAKLTCDELKTFYASEFFSLFPFIHGMAR